MDIKLIFEEISNHLMNDEKPSIYLNSIIKDEKYNVYPINKIFKLQQINEF